MPVLSPMQAGKKEGASSVEDAPGIWPPANAGGRWRSAAQAGAHELLALLAGELLVARLLVAGCHLVLLRLLLGRRGGIVALQAGAHELLALLAGELLVGGLLIARLHQVLLLLLRRGRLLLGFRLCCGRGL